MWFDTSVNQSFKCHSIKRQSHIQGHRKFTICVSLLTISVVIPVVTGLEVAEPNSLEFAISLEYIQLLIG